MTHATKLLLSEISNLDVVILHITIIREQKG